MSRRISPIATLNVLAACQTAGYGVLFTVVGDFRTAYGISESGVGLIIGVGFLAGFLSQVFIAPIADRGQARTVVVFGVVLNVVGLVLMAIGQSLGVLLLARIISGLGIGAAAPAIRRIVIVIDPDKLGENLGRLLSSEVFGFAVGPVVSAILVGPFGLAAPFFVTAAVTLAGLALTLALAPDEHGPSETPDQRLALDLLRLRPVAGAVVLSSAVYLMIGTFDALWDVVHEDLGTATWVANLGISIFALPLIIFGPLSGRLAQRHGPFRLASLGLAIASLLMATYGILPSGGWIFAVAMIHAFTDGMTISASGVALAMTAPLERQAGAQGVAGAANALTAGFTSIAIGWLYGAQGRAAAYATTAVGMIALVTLGLYLGRSFWRADGHRSVETIAPS